MSERLLYLVRHAQPQIQTGICYGRTDLALEPKAQVQLLVKLQAKIPKQIHLLTSPLQRCEQTAQELAALGWQAPQIDPRVAEMDFGDWEGQAWSDIERGQIDEWAKDIVNYRPPQGESVKDVAQRALEAISELSFEQDVAIITHAGVIQVLTKLLQRQALENFSSRKIEFGSITVLKRSISPANEVEFSLLEII
jgi:alpha-ribazole phosphatase